MHQLYVKITLFQLCRTQITSHDLKIHIYISSKKQHAKKALLIPLTFYCRSQKI